MSQNPPRMRRSPIILVLIVAMGLVSLPASAGGATLAHLPRPIVRRDGNDTRSPLDLRWMRLVHATPYVDQLTFATWNGVTDAELDPVHHGNFGVGIDLNNHPRHYEYIVYVSFVAGRLRGLIYDAATRRTKPTTAARLGPRTFRVNLPERRIGGEFRFFLFGFYEASPCSSAHPCMDVIPNRFPLPVLDPLQPRASTTLRCDPCVSSNRSTDLAFPYPFKVADERYGSGIRRWAVQDQVVGDTTWTTVAGGGSDISSSAEIDGAEGVAYNVRIYARDRSGNVTQSTQELIFPYDDQHPGVVSYSGAWTHPTSSTSYLGTTSVSSTDGDTATFSFTGGRSVCAVGMNTAGSEEARLYADCVGGYLLDEYDGIGDRHLLNCLALVGDSSTVHSVDVTVDGAPDGFVLDGLVVTP